MRTSAFSAQELSILSWAIVALCVEYPHLSRAIAAQANLTVKQFTILEMMRFAWGIAGFVAHAEYSLARSWTRPFRDLQLLCGDSRWR